MENGVWASLYSGGKDSAYARYAAEQTGRPVGHLITVHPPEDSYLYHVPATHLAELAATSMDIPLWTLRIDSTEFDPTASSSDRGDRELEPLEQTLRDIKARVPALVGITTGAVASTFQYDRIDALASRLGLDVFAPLWNTDPYRSAQAMIDAGFEIIIVQVAAAGFDETWLGRSFTESTLADLRRLESAHGVHPLGEGGEYETLVTDGPHMARPIRLEYDVRWDGTRGDLDITNAWLE